MILLDWNGKSDAPRRGDIFRARIESVNRGIEAAFADLGSGYKGYLPLEGDKSLKAGAELSVQVDKEAVKTKLPVLTRQLSLPGKYLVLLPEGRGISWSRKIDPESLPADLSERLAPYAQDSGLIVRTNAADAEPESILQEAGRLSELAKRIPVRAEHSLCPSLLLKGEAEYLALLRDLREGEAEEILTDDQEIFREAIRRTGVAPGEILFIDDSPRNVEAAAAAGMRSALYIQGENLEELIENHLES